MERCDTERKEQHEQSLHKISNEELDEILEKHRKWVEAGEDEKKEGYASLADYDLKRKDLRGKILNKALLIRADLRYAKLGGAVLKGARMSEAFLQNAEFQNANLQGALINKACLKNAVLLEAKLQGAYLDDANLEEANLEGARCETARFTGACLQGANLKGASLVQANLEEASLWGANIKRADLRAANLEGANVSNIKFNRKGRYQGIRVATSYGSARFTRFAQHQDFIEELRGAGGWRTALYKLWKVSADCGRTPWAWIGWSLSFVFGFGLAFFLMRSQAFDMRSLDHSFGSMMYYSVVTFTTLGFGDITPAKGYAAYVVMAEVVIGYIMLGGLISILGNTLFRRG